MVWEKKVEKECNVDCSIVSHQQSTICRPLTVAIYLIAVVLVGIAGHSLVDFRPYGGVCPPNGDHTF